MMLSSVKAFTFSLIARFYFRAFSFLPEQVQEDVARGIKGSLDIFTETILLTFVLELVSIPAVKGVLKQRGGKSLYLSAIFLNLFNHLFLAIPLYVLAHVYFGGVLGFWVYEQPLEDYFQSSLRIIAALLVHAICYYHVHRFFHTSRKWYKFHAYHHRFNTYVTPVSAMAVTPVEYCMGYILPFALAAFVVWPLFREIKMAIYIETICNLLIHTPRLEKITENVWPTIVTPYLHIEHHKRLYVNYAAPILNVDWFVEQFERTVCKFNSSSVFGRSGLMSGKSKPT